MVMVEQKPSYSLGTNRNCIDKFAAAGLMVGNSNFRSSEVLAYECEIIIVIVVVGMLFGWLFAFCRCCCCCCWIFRAIRTDLLLYSTEKAIAHRTDEPRLRNQSSKTGYNILIAYIWGDGRPWLFVNSS